MPLGFLQASLLLSVDQSASSNDFKLMQQGMQTVAEQLQQLKDDEARLAAAAADGVPTPAGCCGGCFAALVRANRGGRRVSSSAHATQQADSTVVLMTRARGRSTSTKYPPEETSPSSSTRM